MIRYLIFFLLLIVFCELTPETFALGPDPSECNNSASVQSVCPVGSTPSCTYPNIRDAVNGAVANTTIKVKSKGTPYNELIEFINKDGTATNPICLVADTGSAPIIDRNRTTGGGGATGNGIRIFNTSSFIVIKGFEISNSHNGILNEAPNVTITGNYIHDNWNQGILTQEKDNVSIINNVIDRNGVYPKCTGFSDPDTSGDDGCIVEAGKTANQWSCPVHCHCIYYSACLSTTNSEIRDNVCSNQAGPGIWMKETCSGDPPVLGVNGTIVENNLFRNVAVGINSRGAHNNIIRNNTFYIDDWPMPDKVTPAFLQSERGTTNNTYVNNIFYTTLNTVMGVNFDTSVGSQTWVKNFWRVIKTNWFDNGSSNSSFSANFLNLSGDTGQCCNVAPGFVNTAQDNFKILSTSAVKNLGANGGTNCALKDFFGIARPQEGTCDPGYHEYFEEIPPPPPVATITDTQYTTATNPPCPDANTNKICDSDTIPNALAAIAKGTTYALWIRIENWSNTISGIRQWARLSTYSVPASEGTTPIAYIDKLFRNFIGLQNTGLDWLVYYANGTDNPGIKVGGTDWLWGNDIGSFSENNVYCIDISCSKRWYGFKVDYPPEALDAQLWCNDAVLKFTDNSVGAVFRESDAPQGPCDVTLQGSMAGDSAPTVKFNKFDGDTIDGCPTIPLNTQAPMLPLAVSYTVGTSSAVSSLMWKCIDVDDATPGHQGCSQTTEQSFISQECSPAVAGTRCFNVPLSALQNKIQVSLIDNASPQRSVQASCDVEYTAPFFFKIGGGTVGR